jgi:hypothetical protein
MGDQREEVKSAYSDVRGELQSYRGSHNYIPVALMLTSVIARVQGNRPIGCLPPASTTPSVVSCMLS